MRMPSKETVEALRRAYPVGCAVELEQMDDPQAPPIGTNGKVVYVPSMWRGARAAAWASPTGRTAAGGLIMTEKVRDQILSIRDTGLTNMFDIPVVQRLAYDRVYYELVIFLEEHRKEYARFILTGEADMEADNG